MTSGVLLDGVVIALLLAACGYAMFLSRRLGALKAGQSEMAKAIADFDAASRRAEAVLQRMEAAGLANGRELEGRASRAASVSDELAVMIAAGERVADRIESALADVKAVGARKARAA